MNRVHGFFGYLQKLSVDLLDSQPISENTFQEVHRIADRGEYDTCQCTSITRLFLEPW